MSSVNKAMGDILARAERQEDGCLVWTRDNLPKGYGRIWWQGKKRLVHRVVAHLAHGLDLDNPKEQALHRCDNKPCIEPTHLYVGDHAQNFRDAVDRDRICFGTRQWKNRLTPEQVVEIEADAHQIGTKATARKWGLTAGHVSNIKNHKVWRRLWQ